MSFRPYNRVHHASWGDACLTFLRWYVPRFIVAPLLQFRGDGGPLKKKRKFAVALASTIEQGQKVSFVAHMRRIERVEAEEKENNESE